MTVKVAITAIVAVILIATPCHASQQMRDYSAQRPVHGAQPPLRATITFGSGRAVIRAGTSDRLYLARMHYDSDRFAPVQHYDYRTGLLKVGLDAIGGMGIRVTSSKHLAQHGKFEFSPDVPLRLEADLDAGSSLIDLGGLNLVDVTLRSGVADNRIDVSKPTTGRCESARFFVGGGELIVNRLANANCDNVELRGGAGRVELDFGGEWRRDIEVTAALTMGTLTLRVPEGVGLRITANDRFLSRLSSIGLVRNGSVWESPRYAAARHHVDVDLTASLADVRVERIK